MTDLHPSHGELPAFDLSAAMRFWQGNLHLIAADAILATYVDEHRRRVADTQELDSNAAISDFA